MAAVVGVGVALPQALPLVRSSAELPLPPIMDPRTTVRGRATITDLRQGMRWATACSGLSHTIRVVERILGTMDIGIHVLDRIWVRPPGGGLFYPNFG